MKEDINILEEKINNIKKYNTYRYDWTETDVQTVENLIKVYKEIEEDYTSVYLSGFYDGENKWKSKIKEKIEEVNKSNGYSPVNKILIEQVLNSILKIGG